MNSCFNEDEALILLNDVTMTDEELRENELTDIEKRKLKTDIMGKIKSKNSKRKKWTIAAAIAFTVIVSIPLTRTDAFEKMISKLAIVPGIGEVMMEDKGFALKNSMTNNNVTINSMYIDQNKIAVTLTVEHTTKYDNSPYSLRDDKGNVYELKITNRSVDNYRNMSAYKAEYIGEVKKASKYTLSVDSHQASFTLKDSDFAEVSEAKTLYTATNGNTALNITSVKREGDILKIDYYATDFLTALPANMQVAKDKAFNFGTFKDEEEYKKRGVNISDPSIEIPYFQLIDEDGNKEYGHSSSSNVIDEYQSSFNLKKLKGKKMKLILPSVNYEYQRKYITSQYAMVFDVPKEGKTMLNREEEFVGFKYKILSIERLSDKMFALHYEFIDDNTSKLQPRPIGMFMNIGENTDSVSSCIDKGKLKIVIASRNPIGDKVKVDPTSISYASVGPFEFELDLDKIIDLDKIK